MLLIIRERQIKTTMRSHLTSQNGHHQKVYKQNLERVQGHGTSPTLLVGMLMDTATMENSVEIP